MLSLILAMGLCLSVSFIHGQPVQAATVQHINQVNDGPGAVNVYFNKSALTQYASPGNEANYQVNLEDRLLTRINGATRSIDLAVYELNLPRVVDALINRAAAGVPVRVIVDAKDPSDAESTERYQLMRVYLEKLIRGKDGRVKTADDVHVYGDSAVFAVEDSAYRSQYGLPANGYTDFPQKTVTVGSSPKTGYLMAEGEQKVAGSYYAPDNQMHNKFAVIDDTWVWTGSWNLTTTGLYGSDANREAGILDGNTNNSIELNSGELAAIYETEFNEMWGSNTTAPNPDNSNFGSRKLDNTSHVVQVGGKTVEVYFSGGDNALGKVNQYLTSSANINTYFNIFSWSDQTLLDTLKVKWEGSASDMQGSLTGFDIKGVFDSAYWNQWWSASIDMTGRTASQTSQDNPNTRWKNPAPVYPDQESRKLHHKYMIVDADTSSDPTVITGSTNWSANGNDTNDENLLFIHDAAVANQYKQEFFARYQQAGGQLP
jgi:phosphatidylserine/phosphatidylglycerophosphate/cardiolipin synthase-like enzyme